MAARPPSCALQLGPHQIRVNAIGPGYVDTDLFVGLARAEVGDDEAAQQSWRQQREAKVPLGRFVTAVEVAETTLFLCSDAASAFTGSILHPDGGSNAAFGGG